MSYRMWDQIIFNSIADSETANIKTKLIKNE